MKNRQAKASKIFRTNDVTFSFYVNGERKIIRPYVIDKDNHKKEEELKNVFRKICRKVRKRKTGKWFAVHTSFGTICFLKEKFTRKRFLRAFKYSYV